MFTPELTAKAEALLSDLRSRRMRLATAESCTGGLVAGLLTEIAGSSDVVERGFVTYSNEAKQELLGVSEDMLARHGAVSEPVARAMATGALCGRTPMSPFPSRASLVRAAAASPSRSASSISALRAAGGTVLHRECRFGDIGRGAVRLASVDVALQLLARSRRRATVNLLRALLEGAHVAAEGAIEQRADQHLQHHRLEFVGDREIHLAAARRRLKAPSVLDRAERTRRVRNALDVHRKLRRRPASRGCGRFRESPGSRPSCRRRGCACRPASRVSARPVPRTAAGTADSAPRRPPDRTSGAA